MDAGNPTENFRAAMQVAGYNPGDIVLDGKLHRFPHEDRNGGRAGWYILYGGGIPARSFGDWRTSRTFTWCAKGEVVMSETEKAEYRQSINQQKALRQQAERREKAREVLKPIAEKAITAAIQTGWTKPCTSTTVFQRHLVPAPVLGGCLWPRSHSKR